MNVTLNKHLNFNKIHLMFKHSNNLEQYDTQLNAMRERETILAGGYRN